ncbi:F-box domain containing protein [Trema orientale]|uniref:F-box domain containing protein n=1 Tax=Trema orientale TaxID=63057 RepID=A0A2P5B9B6_TREOI|nr:F-box domain containing protein [Trema orientale]
MTPPLTTLPEDLIFNEILPRLPVKSLVRLQSVCKPWQRFLTGPNRRLVSMHLWRHRNKYVMIKHRRRYAPAVHAITLLSRERTILVDSLQIPFESHFRFMRVAGSCNGLVCVTDSEFSGAPELPIILWNPSLRKFRALPRSIFSSVLNTVELHERIGQIVHGFGYHPVLDDHRLVRILYLYGEFEVLRIRSEMYSLRTNSWKEVGEPFYHRFLDATCVASDGVLHWIVSSGSSLHFDFVLCFDLRREEFRRLEMPHISLRSRLGTRLAESAEGRLCLIACTPHEAADDDKMVHVWDLNYEGFVWEKKLSVGPFPRIDRLLGCGLNGEIYLEDKGWLCMIRVVMRLKR